MIKVLNFFSGAFKAAKQATALDVADLSYLYLPHNIQYQISLKSGVPKSGVGLRIASFFWNMAKSLWKKPLKISLNLQDQPLFFAVTNNQDRVLRPLVQEISKSYFVGINNFGNEQLPLFWPYLAALPFFPLVLFKFLFAKGIEKKAFHYVFDAYWLSYGFYIFLIWLLRKTRPSVIVLSNDHLMWTRTLIQAAREEKFKTIYIQHASVTERFPPLTVDYALLDGNNAAGKYASRGASKTKVFLVGIPHFDLYLAKLNVKSNVENLGICVGMLDELPPVITLCEVLRNTLPDKKLFIRSHPGDARAKEWEQIASQGFWGYSDGKKEDAFHFITHMDVILAGDSNILLEAALMNVLPVYYDFMGTCLDWYGFLENGLVVYYSEPLSVSKFIKEIEQHGYSYNFRAKAKAFCATIGTKYDGRSSELAIRLINQIAHDKIDYTLWHPQQFENGLIVHHLNLAL